jgi:3-deoxy-D-manno-octulosonate 8-phosphate phosphatase (KDO 8-P phosphatase)
MPSHLPAEIRKQLEPVRLLVLDVDGVLTDGRLYIAAEGELVKSFHVRDGLGIRLLLDAGIKIGIITGRRSALLEARCRELGIDSDLVVQASKDKNNDLDAMQLSLGLDDSHTAAMGDDLPDLPILRRAVLSACPADAAPEVVAVCDVVCRSDGGRGAVRELAELLLKGQHRWIEVTQKWTMRDEGIGD